MCIEYNHVPGIDDVITVHVKSWRGSYDRALWQSHVLGAARTHRHQNICSSLKGGTRKVFN